MISAARPQSPSQLVPVDSRQPDVDKRTIEIFPFQSFKAGQTVLSHFHLVSVKLEKGLQHRSAVRIVLND